MNVNRVLSGIFSSWASFLVTAATSFVMAPVLVRRLGADGYGLWSLYMAITGYFALLDFGVSPAIVRYTSKYYAVGDSAAEKRIVATGMCFFLLVGGLVLLVSGVGTVFYEQVFPTPAVPLQAARLTFLLVGLDFAFVLPCAVFQGILLGHQQYLALNGLNISIRLMRFTLVLTLLEPGAEGLITVAAIFLGTGLIRDLGFILLARRQLNGIPSVKLFESSALKELLSYSLPAFVIAISLRVQAYTDSLVIGYVIGVGAITSFSLASSLVDYVHEIGWGLTSVLVPVVSSHEARGEIGAIRKQFLAFTRYCVWLMAPIMAVATTLSESFFMRWVGDEYRSSARLLDVLLAAMAIHVILMPGQAVLKGMGKHTRLAAFMAIEAGLNLALSLWWAQALGVMGVALGTLVPRFLISGLMLSKHSLKVLDIGIKQYFVEGFAPCIPGSVVLLGMALYWQLKIQEPFTWTFIVVTALLFVVVFAVVTFSFGTRADEREWVFAKGRALQARVIKAFRPE